MKVVQTEDSSPAIGPYSQALCVDGWVYTSGAVGLRPGGESAGEGIEEQTRQTLDNLRAVLAAGGCALLDVVKTTVYLVDMDDFSAVNAIYAEYFGDHRPARSCVEVRRLPRDLRLEIDAVARVPESGAGKGGRAG